MQLSDLLSIILIFLTIAMAIAGWSQYLRLPFTVLLVMAGLAINAISSVIGQASLIAEFRLTPELVLYIFLPSLIFESALSLDSRALLKDLVPVIVMAIPGMLLSAVLVGLGLVLSLQLNWVIALLFGALISATDPVAVIALFKELGVSRRLTVLVEGESLFNDATAIVLFNIVLGFTVLDRYEWSDALSAVIDFVRVFFGGALTGALAGILFSEFMIRIGQGQRSYLLVLSLIMAYLSFIVAERVFHVSGVMSVLSSAISFKIVGLPRLSGDIEPVVDEFWQTVALVFNSLLFILIGLSVDIESLAEYWHPVLWAILAVMIARAVSVYLLMPLTTYLFDLPKINLGSRHIMWWGGLKGGLAFAIVLSLPDSLGDKGLLIELTVGVVLVSLLINASTLRPLIRWLKIDRLNDEEWLELQQGLSQLKHSVDEVLQSFSRMNLLDSDLQSTLAFELHSKLPSNTVRLTDDQRLKQLHLAALQAEKEELDRLHDIGLVNYYTYLNFKDILRKDRAKTLDELLETNTEEGRKNPFLRFEMSMIHFLNEYEWTLNWLVKYQSSRFSNLIRHDIAGVLMAHVALRQIKHADPDLHGEKFETIKKIYQNRLHRRQNRLKRFGELFADFYHQYESRLFQEVALLYSRRLLAEEHEHGKLSSKVFRRLERCLNDAQKQLPPITTRLGLAKRDDWLDSVPLFSGLPKKVLKDLAEHARYISFLPGDTVFNEGDRGDCIYVLVSGRANVFQKDELGQSYHVAELRQGSFIGEHALSAEAVRTASVRAKTYITVLRLSVEQVIGLSKKAPDLANRLRDAEFGHYA
ncbi:MAG: hypothetical protein Kow0065_10470 [Methylomicrobium sp.]